MSQDPSTTGERFERLVGIMARLRAPGGCPWDREQNFDTIKPYLLEETYEVFDAIDQRDWQGLAEELGDLMLQAVFFAQMASEEGKFRIDDSLDAISEKLIRRHPHVFGDGTAKTSDDVKRRWDERKDKNCNQPVHFMPPDFCASISAANRPNRLSLMLMIRSSSVTGGNGPRKP